MTIKLNRQWRHWTPGSVIESLGDGICAELIRRGVAIEVPVAKRLIAPERNKQLKYARNK